MDCKFNKIDNKFKCEACGFISPIDARRNCHIERESNVAVTHNSDSPSLPGKILNFGRALINHVKTGWNSVPKEEIQRRFKICEGCEFFRRTTERSGFCGHQSCGCNIKDEEVFLNKLSWADQECPIKKWVKYQQESS